MSKKGVRAGSRQTRVCMETMEGRTLLSAAVGGSIGTTISAPVAGGVVGVAVTFHPVVGISYAGDVGLLKLATGVTPAASMFQGTIAWGDSSATTPATFVLETDGQIHVQGTHTYGKVATYPVTVSVYQGLPVTTTGSVIVIKSTAIVDQNSPGGVTVTAVAGKAFTGVVGTFQLPPTLTPTPIAGASPLPAPLLTASINWGNGQVSTGQVIRNVDGTYSVLGTGTYKTAGTYRITVTVIEQISPTGISKLLTTIYSTALVAPSPVAG